jgi:5,6-dimethylbenzimidazole synthase
VRECLDTPPDWALVAYLCIGWPKEAHSIPELERKKWQERLPIETFLIDR